MGMKIGDAGYVKGKIGEMGDQNNCPNTKKYNNVVGTKLATVAYIGVAIGIVVNLGLDLLFPRKQRQESNNNNRWNGNKRRH